MKNYTTELIELHSIRSDLNTFFLNAKTVFKKETILLELEVDQETYQQINQVVAFEDHARYRLSLRYKWDPFRKDYLSTITKSKGSSVESYDFICSKKYVEIINQLRNIHSQKNILAIKGLKYIEVKGRDEKNRAKLDIQTFNTRNIRKPAKILIGVVVSSICFFLSINNVLININIFPQTEENDSIVSVSSERSKNSALAHIKEEKEQVDQQLDKKSNEQVENKTNNIDMFYQVESELMYGLPENYVALTFDDGPSKYTKEIIDILVEYEVKATFFFIGQNVLKYPDSVSYAKDQSMSIGNHSWSHEDLSKISSDEQIKDLVATNDVLSNILGEPVTLFRPPYGESNNKLKHNVHNEEMKTILWNRDPEDWGTNSAEEVLQYFYNSDSSGAIYLLHEKRHTVEALPKILEYLKQNNIKIVVLTNKL